MTTKSNSKWLAFDFETSDQNRYSCKIDRVCVGEFNITGRKTGEWDFCFRGTRDGGLQNSNLRKIMASTSPKVAHNAGFDLYLMEERLCVPVGGEIHDTMLMVKHWKNDLPAYDLKSLSWWLFGDLYLPLLDLRKWIHENNRVGEDDDAFNMCEAPDDLVHRYCLHDVEMTAKIATMMWPKVKDNYAYQQDTEVIRLNSELEARGIKADVPYYRDFIRLGTRRIRRNTKAAAEDLGVVGTKRKPTGNALREHLASLGESRKTPTGLIQADDVVLRDYKKSAPVRAVRRIRSDQKQVNTYAKNILAVVNRDGVFHPNLRQSSAITRRWRSSTFYGDSGAIVRGNAQNFPRGAGIRTGIIVPSGFAFVKFDLASIEARLGAHAMCVFVGNDYYAKRYRGDPKFNVYLDVIERCTGHGKVTKQHDLYTPYKHAVLGIQYGVGVDTFHTTLTEKFELNYTWEECNEIYRKIRSECPEFVELQRAVTSLIRAQGYIQDDFGAIYYIPEEEEYKGVNYYCQGCAGNVFKWWWVHCDPLLKDSPHDYFFNIVHDEFDGAIKRDRGAKKRVVSYCDVMGGLDLFELPLTAEASDLCHDWGQAG